MIRPATEGDVPEIVAMVHELAEYEHAPEECHLTEHQLTDALFGPTPALFGHVALVDGEAAGCALWFLNFSTGGGARDLPRRPLRPPALPGHGLGRALLARLAQECVTRGLGRLEWSVLDWNAPSIGFYRALGAVSLDEWTTFRLDGAALTALGSTAPTPTPGTVR